MEKLLWPRVISENQILSFENCQQSDFSSPFQDLPAEILIEIFKICDVKELIALSMVCKRFNWVIIGDKKLLQKFTLHLDDETVKAKWIGSRKYSRVKIVLCEIYGDFFQHDVFMSSHPLHLHLNDFKRILNFQCPHLTHLTIVYPNTTLNPLKDLLVACKNLKFIEICQQTEIIERKKFFVNPLPQLHLNELRLSCHLCSIINMLMECQVRRFYLNNRHFSYCCGLSFRQFQLKQVAMEVKVLPKLTSFEDASRNFAIESFDRLNRLDYWHY